MVTSKSLSAPLVVVVAATGNQGGSVVRALVESSREYRIRALTRDADSVASQKLAKQGAQVVAADLDSSEGVKAAFKDAEIVFVVTPPGVMMSGQEIAWGKSLVDAAKAVGVNLFIYSGLQSAKRISNGKYPHVTGFNDKETVAQYALEVFGAEHFVSVEPGGYYENINGQGPLALKKGADGSLTLIGTVDQSHKLPMLYTAGDYGLWVQAAIEHKSEVGTELLASTEEHSVQTQAEILSRVLGKKVTAQLVSVQQFHDILPGPMPEPFKIFFSEMIGSAGEFGYYGPKDFKTSLAHLSRKPLSFEDWARQQDWSVLA